MKKLYEFYKKVTRSESVRIGIYVLIGSTVIVMLLSFFYGDYSNVSEPGFWEGLRVEAHGMLFDILVIGVIVLLLNKLTEKDIDNRRYLEEIDDFRGWESEEAAYRNAGNLNRLKRNRFRGKLNLKQCYLGCVDLREYQDDNLLGYIKPYLECSNLKGVKIAFADLQKVNLTNVKLRGAVFFEVDLQGAELLNVDLRNVKNQILNNFQKSKPFIRLSWIQNL